MSRKSHFKGRKSIVGENVKRAHWHLHFFLSPLCSWTKICQSQQGVFFWWKSVLTKLFQPASLAPHKHFRSRFQSGFGRELGVRMQRGNSFQYPSVMYQPVEGLNPAKSFMLMGRSQTKIHSFWLADSPGQELKLSLNVKCSCVSWIRA